LLCEYQTLTHNVNISQTPQDDIAHDAASERVLNV